MLPGSAITVVEPTVTVSIASGPFVMVTPLQAGFAESTNPQDALAESHVMVQPSAAASDEVPVCAKYMKGWI